MLGTGVVRALSSHLEGGRTAVARPLKVEWGSPSSSSGWREVKSGFQSGSGPITSVIGKGLSGFSGDNEWLLSDPRGHGRPFLWSTWEAKVS